jgi:hypothetical protein
MAKFNKVLVKFTHFKKKYNIMKTTHQTSKPICCRIGHKIYSLPLELYGYLLVLILADKFGMPWSLLMLI